MIKVTLEFATPVDAAAFLTTGKSPAPYFATKVEEHEMPPAICKVKTDTTDNAAAAPKAAKKDKAAPKAKEELAVKAIEYKEVQAATFNVAGLPGGPDLIKSVLAEFGVDHATRLKPEQWEEYLERANEVHEENKPAESLA